MAYKIRKSLEVKIEAALAAAAKKEGGEITAETIDCTQLKRKDVAYYGNKNYLLMDGRYVTKFWDGENDVYLMKAIDNLPVEILRCMVENDHDVATQGRRKDDYEDFKYQNYLKRVDSGESNLVNPMDCCICVDTYFKGKGDENKDEDDFDYSFAPVHQSVIPHQTPIIGYTPSGHFNSETDKEINKILRGFLRTLPPEKYEWFRLLYSSGTSQKKFAIMEGISEAAISKRKKWYEDKIADYFQSLGYPVLSKAERSAEKKKQQKKRETYEDHFKKVSKALREIYCPEEDEETAVA